jgi:hypothetical protein
MWKVSDLRNLMATSRASRGLRKIDGLILLQTTGIAIVTAEARTPDFGVCGSSLAEASNRQGGRLPLGSGLESKEVPQTSTGTCE